MENKVSENVEWMNNWTKTFSKHEWDLHLNSHSGHITDFLMQAIEVCMYVWGMHYNE
jgi:hypothetical protein